MVGAAIAAIRVVLRGLRDGVVAAMGEGVAAGDAAEGQPAAAQPAVANDGDVGVLAAGGKEFALGNSEDVQQRRKCALVQGQQSGGDAFAARAGGRVGHAGSVLARLVEGSRWAVRS